MSEITRFYRQPSSTSDLGRHADLSPGLPADPEALGAIVRGLLVHNYTAMVQGLAFPAERMAHMQTVGAEATLDNVFSLDPAPLSLERPAERRMVGFCYHFALLHCALLRATGTPARIRCGFAGYFEAQRWIDHWVVEYWDGDRRRLTDPQIGRSDLTGDDFQTGVTAWNQCRGGASPPALHGNGELWGWDELRGSLINDVAALNKVEVSGWYWCDRLKVEPLDQPHDELDTSLDILSRLAATAESPETIKECFDLYPELQPPADAVARWNARLASIVQAALMPGGGKPTRSAGRAASEHRKRRGSMCSGRDGVLSESDLHLASPSLTAMPHRVGPLGPHARRVCGGRGGAERRRLDLRTALLGNTLASPTGLTNLTNLAH